MNNCKLYQSTTITICVIKSRVNVFLCVPGLWSMLVQRVKEGRMHVCTCFGACVRLCVHANKCAHLLVLSADA